MTEDIAVNVKQLTMGYENNILLKDVDFQIGKQDIFIIMGASGCGKSSLLRILTGLTPAMGGEIWIGDVERNKANASQNHQLMIQAGVLYQSGALFSSMTLAENVSLPLQYFSELSDDEIRQEAYHKLSLVGLEGFEDYYPSEISGGMKKRAGLARALSLNPSLLYFDEPSAGLDPISSSQLDDLIKDIQQKLHTTIVVVSHELDSIFSIGTNAIFLDAQAKKITGFGKPQEWLKNPPTPEIYRFLTRGGEVDHAS